MSIKKNEREQARDVLIHVFKNKTPLSHHITALSPFSRNLCFGVCRYANQLESLADVLLKKRPKGLDLWITLLMGLYQLHHLKLADYAVVQETVALLNTPKTRWARGLINATLRQYCRDKDNILHRLATNERFINNHPQWFVDRLKKAWPSDWKNILQDNDKHPPMTLRFNTQKTTASTYLEALKEIDSNAKLSKHSPEGLTLSTPCDVQHLPGFQEGWISVQDEAAQLATTLLDLKPKLRVLDACCAPGGKTAHMLEKEPKLATCIALDIEARRLSRVQDNLTRLQLEATLIQADASDVDAWWDGKLFDRILLDAPCSATGVIRRHPDIKHLRTEEEVLAITQLQKKLLEALWPCLSKGGLFIYATCSIFPEENELQINDFIKTHPDCTFVEKELPWGRKTGHGYQILPGEDGMDGFFYSILVKR